MPTADGKVEYTKEPDCDFLNFVRGDLDKTNLHITPYASKKDMEIIKCVKPGGNYMDVPDSIATKRILYFKKTGGRTTTYGRLDPEKPAYTLNTYFDRPNIGCNIHYNDDRMISIREGMRLQSFPDSFDLCSSSKRNYYVQVGNAVPPLLGLAWAKHLKNILKHQS
jgi:Site-specific DNA methylase